jgi:hypothetical protein
MYFNPFDYRTTQLCLEERLREAQACHARQRRMMQQLGQAMSWVGNQLILWRRYLQTQPQTLDRQNN